MKLNSKIHGIVDYLVVIFLCISPTVFSLPHTTALFTYALAGIHLCLTLATNFELGLLKIIPLKIHGIIELIVSILLLCIAFYLGPRQGRSSEIFYLAFGTAVFVTWVISDYKSDKASA
jgi:hypothetical protein